MKKPKLKLEEIRVQSFVTLVESETQKAGAIIPPITLTCMIVVCWTNPAECDYPTINDSCFSACDDICNDF